VFGVKQQPVEAGETKNFGGDRVREGAPAANQALAGKDSLAKSVRESGFDIKFRIQELRNKKLGRRPV
jgi:hypothetical protein